ncbi:MAG: DUF302 domain-containing protein [Caldilineae bacterium]|nr:DUF302 domain-containing protein [Anaerolineae bacterium]MCB9143480.1 DUF302 domain-containing protein [Anaerolineales bacterium]MCB9154290.1 DUF302 domain-containing protein [Caldilineae bacterium]MCB0199658.1 DUF302 domain-containing protein [Anaerolineae bacterium]MCB0203896.1 DUF302 domain-containing protein [Anaerolineae bacterium]
MNAPTNPLGLTAVLPVGYETAIDDVTAALKEQGFGVLTEIDVKETLKKKLDVDVRPYAILGACNPPLAHRALSEDPIVGLMLPCNVVVYDNGDGTTTVSAINPMTAIGVVGNPALNEVAKTATDKLNIVMANLLQRVSEPA